MTKIRDVVVEGGGENLYQISEHQGRFTVYKYHVRLVMNDRTKIGETRNLSDALSLIRSQSGREIKEIK